MLYHIQTFGCQMNEYDSERIASVLESKQMLLSPVEEADIIILNTCSVREKPQHKVESYIGKLRIAQEKTGKPSKIGIMGCVAQQVGEAFLKRFNCVDFVLGTDSLHMLPQTIDDIMEGKRVCERSWREGDFSIESFSRGQSLSSYVTIMKGCNNFCSYCIVPYVRGREASRREAEIIAEVKTLVNKGTKEITLLGQNVNSYGNFPDLLEKVAQIEGISRLRFVTSHPKDFSSTLVTVMAKYSNICPFIHLPLQSGSNEILKRMNRHYTWEHYLDNVERAVEIIPELRFSSDFIVGFPGETEADFDKTLEAMKTIRYESLYAFNYSVRPGTKAEQYKDNVPVEEKTRRLETLLSLHSEITADRYKKSTGNTVSVMVEGLSKRDTQVFTGRTVYNRSVNFTSPIALSIGDEVSVTITEVKPNSLFGKYII